MRDAKSSCFTILFFPAAVFATSGGKTVNLAAFQRLDTSTEFEGVVEGALIPFLTAMKDKKMLAIIHTEGAFGGDVITLQTSVLYHNDSGLGDYGIDCQLSFTEDIESGESYFSLGGVCRIQRVGHGKSSKHILVIPPTPIPESAKEGHEWYLLDEDEESGVAFFVNIGKYQ